MIPKQPISPRPVWWRYLLRDEAGVVVGVGSVRATDRVEAIALVRGVDRSDVLPDVPPTDPTAGAQVVSIFKGNLANDGDFDWSTSKVEVA